MRRLLLIAALCLPWLAHPAPTHYVDIEIDATKVDEAIPVIPVFLSPGDTTFWSTVTGANDVVFYDETGSTALDFYRVAFTDSGTTGTGLFLVNVDGIISASTNETIRVYFGDGSATDQSDGAATFTGTSIAAFYLPGMTTTDITGNGYNLTAVNTPGTAASDIEGVTAATYASASSQYHYVNSSVISGFPFSIETRINKVDTGSFQTIVGAGYSSGGSSLSAIRLDVRVYLRRHAYRVYPLRWHAHRLLGVGATCTDTRRDERHHVTLLRGQLNHRYNDAQHHHA
jgi:hypothetical protein